MDLKTSLVYQIAKLRLRRIEEYSSRLEDLQQEQLRHILTRAARTDFGRRHGLSRSSTYASYREAVPIIDYEGAHPRRLSLVRQVQRYDERPQ